ncbi:MAG: family hydrolase [Frankiales bacterium]|nr:family hydrolase [Frankiales bacterium]
MRTAFVTNNASRHPGVVAAHLTELGIPADPAEVVTSGQAAARTVASRVPVGAAVLVLGTDALAETVALSGLRPVRTLHQAGPDGVAAVVQGLSPATSMADLAEATIALRGGALWVTGNADATLPSPRGLLPGNGAFVEVLRAVTGLDPLVAGKPDPALHLESVARVQSTRPLVVGDRLDTDVLGAVRGGADSLLVLTGVTDLAALEAAPPGSRPTYVSSDLRGLGEPHPPVVLSGRAASCRAATARWDGAQLTVEGDGDDALRARVALAWAVADD